MPISQRERVRLSKAIAKDIMELGDEPGSKCNRIEFKGGDWLRDEKGQGGLCRESLEKFILKSLKNNDRKHTKPTLSS